MVIRKKYSQDKILKLGIGAILHDIGKMVSNGEDHTIEGYKLVKSNNYFSATLCTCIRSHHENEDGSGYPEKLKGTRYMSLQRLFLFVMNILIY